MLFLGVVGACLVAAGAVLGALRPHPRAPLTLLLLMIGKMLVFVWSWSVFAYAFWGEGIVGICYT